MAESERIYYNDPDYDDFVPDEEYDDEVQIFYTDYPETVLDDAYYCNDGDFADEIQDFSEYDDSQVRISPSPSAESRPMTA